MFKRILVPVDGSRHGYHAVETVAGLAEKYQASVYLLHAIRDLSLPPEILEMIAQGEVTESRREILENSAMVILDRAQRTFEEAGSSGVAGAEYVFGDPACRIAEYAQAKDIDLIVIGYRGLGTHDDFLGGMARKLLNISPVSCMIVRTKPAVEAVDCD